RHPFSSLCPYTTLFRSGGGTIADEYGWRVAFYTLAIPGILLAFIVRYTVREPVRGSLDAVKSADAPTLRQTLEFMRTQRSLLHVDRKSTRLNSSHVKIS